MAFFFSLYFGNDHEIEVNTINNSHIYARAPPPVWFRKFKTKPEVIILKKHKYWTDYGKLYPGIDITPEVLTTLRKSDRKMAYMDYELKEGRRTKGDGEILLLPALEVSYDFLLEKGYTAKDSSTTEEEIIAQMQASELNRCISSLEENEIALIHAIFFRHLSEREYARELGISQKAVNKRKHKILAKLKNLISKL